MIGSTKHTIRLGMKSLRKTLFIIMVVLFLMVETSEANYTLILTPQQDASVYDAGGSGFDGIFGVGKQTVGGEEYRFLIQFNFSQINSSRKVNFSALQINIYSGGVNGYADNVVLCEMQSTWLETTVTWESQPTCGAVAGSMVGAGSGYAVVTNSVQAFVNGSKTNYGWKGTDTPVDAGYASFAYTKPSQTLTIEIVNNVSTIPSISFPSNNSRHYNNSINVTWNASTDIDSDSITYNWQMAENSAFTTNLTQSNTSNNFTGSQSTLDGKTYYLRVRSYDTYEYSAWSAILQFTEINRVDYTFSNLSLSDSQIYASSQTATISATITDPDGTITAATAGITYNGTETNYTMTQSGNTWSYPYISGVPGQYTVTHIYATDNDGGTNSTTASLVFTVIPVLAGGGPADSGGGGGAAAGDGNDGGGAAYEDGNASDTPARSAKIGDMVWWLVLTLGSIMSGISFSSRRASGGLLFIGLSMAFLAAWQLELVPAVTLRFV